MIRVLSKKMASKNNTKLYRYGVYLTALFFAQMVSNDVFAAAVTDGVASSSLSTTADAADPNHGLILASDLQNAEGVDFENINYRVGFQLYVQNKMLNLARLSEIEPVSSLAMPVVDGYKFIEAEIISDRFIELRFGKRSECSTQIIDTGALQWYKNPQSLIWDTQTQDWFKIENADFDLVSLMTLSSNDGDVYDPTKILVHECIYKTDGDHKGQSRYRYYNLFTRSFYQEVVLGFNPTFITLLTSTNTNGIYNIEYAAQESGAKFEIVRIERNSDESLKLGTTVFTSDSSPHHYKFRADEKSMVLYRTGGGGFVVPNTVNLAARNPSERLLLTDEELDALTSDVYDVSVEGGFLTYTTHFDKPTFHGRSTGTLTPKGRLRAEKLKLRQELGDSAISRNPLLLAGDLDLRCRMRAIYESEPDAFPEDERANIAVCLSDLFLDQRLSLGKKTGLLGKIVGMRSAILPIPGTDFLMPVYYTLPQAYDPNGWFIVEVHGGPHCRDFNELDIEQQFWTSRGFPHFRPNIRGSSGFGSNYEKASDGQWYQVIDDVQLLINWAKSQGFGSKAIVMGASFGGYAAAAAYAKGYADVVIATNGLYDLNMNLKGITDGRTKYCSGDLAGHQIQYGLTSAIREANSVTTHLTTRAGKMLIIAGLKDDNCLPEESNLLFAKMKELGNHAELVTMGEEGHSPTKPENCLMMLRVMENFIGDITGHPYEANGYSTLLTTPGIVYQRTSAAG